MNFLAHAFLSFEDADILAGNMISDFVKGRKKLDYPPRIQNGIRLHRQIDQFTDSHALTARARIFFKADYGLYSGAFVDVAFDYFLANDPLVFASHNELASFAQKVYDQLEKQEFLFPDNFRTVLKYMKAQNWLLHYRSRPGIFNSFQGLVRRASFMHDATRAIELFNNHIQELNECYRLFFPELRSFAGDCFRNESA